METPSIPSALRSRIEAIDRQLLDILLPHDPLSHEQLKKIAVLEHARTATWRLLIEAEEADGKT